MKHPAACWLLYIPSPPDDSSGQPEVGALMPGFVDRTELGDDARRVLGAAHAYHLEHSNERAVFFAEITAWIEHDKRLSWRDLEVDFETALADLDNKAPVIYVEVDPATCGVVATASTCATLSGSAARGSVREMLVDAKVAILNVLDESVAIAR